MPEIKHQFTGGKMNKDLDERLVPNGEYRDAMNIQVSTSESSDVGTVQNILGNSLIVGQDFIGDDAFCVGSVADEKNDKLYYLIDNKKQILPDTYFKNSYNFYKSSSITANFKGDGVVINSNIVAGATTPSYPGFGTNTLNLEDGKKYKVEVDIKDFKNSDSQGDIKIFVAGGGTGNSSYRPLNNNILAASGSMSPSGNYPLNSADTYVNIFTFDQASNDNSTQMRLHFEITNGTVYEKSLSVNSISILELNEGRTANSCIIEYDNKSKTITPVLIDSTDDVLNFSRQRLITGINIINDMLFFTDNYTEPKKINIPRSIKGTGSDFTHTQFINDYNDIETDIKEEHITVIKKQPILAPSIKLNTQRDLNKAYTALTRVTSNDSLDIDAIVGSFFDFTNLELGSEFKLRLFTDINDNDDFQLAWNVGDELAIKSFQGQDYDQQPAVPLTDFNFKVKILEDVANSFSGASFSNPLNLNSDFNLPTMLYWTQNYSSSNYFAYNAAQNRIDVDSSAQSWAKFYSDEIDFVYGATYEITIDIERDSGRYSLQVQANAADLNITSHNHNVRVYNTGDMTTDGVQTFTFKFESGQLGYSVPPLFSNPYTLSSNYNNKFFIQGSSTASGGFVGRINSFSIRRIDNLDPYVKVRVISMGIPPQGVPPGLGQLNYVVDRYDENLSIFEFKLPRIAYRYRYQDNEYSAISPYSQVAFIPGNFDYHPKKGYNLGMSNRITSIDVSEFKKNIPDGVKEIDIIYKEDTSTNLYVVDTITPNANLNSGNAWIEDKYTIKNEQIYKAITANQLIRPWDNVPKTALAQEVVGSRIVYANYKQGFDLKYNNEDYYPDFNFSILSESIGEKPLPSIKSLRDYQIGAVFVDEYGRETPVISNFTATNKLSKTFSDKQNKLSVSFNNSSFPDNLKYFKFFIKETSGEYYNMAMDRFYNAEDNQIWLSFPSSDVNKVNIDDFLILKKGIEKDNLVKEEARYKILDIQNEAPDFIKQKKLLIESLTQNTSSTPAVNIFSQNSSDNTFPIEGKNTFKMDYEEFTNSVSTSFDSEDNALYIEFANTTTNVASKRYRITKIKSNFGQAGVTLASAEYTVFLEKPLGPDVNFIINDINNVSSVQDNITVRIYRYEVENSAKFDGKFFIKINADGVIGSNILTSELGGNLNSDYRTLFSKRLYSMDSDHTNLHRSLLTGQSLGQYNEDFGRFAPYFRNYIHAPNERQMNEVGAGTGGGTLAIDVGQYAFASGSQVSNLSRYFRQTFLTSDWRNEIAFITVGRDVNTATSYTGGGWSGYSNYSGGAWYAASMQNEARRADSHGWMKSERENNTVWFIDKGPKVAKKYLTGSNNLNLGGAGITAATTGSGFSETTGLLQIDIAIGGVLRNTDYKPNGEPNTVQHIHTSTTGSGQTQENYWNVGENGGNNNYDTEKTINFVNSLSVGNKFRFKEDPTNEVYTVVNSNKYGSIRYKTESSNNWLWEDVLENPTNNNTYDEPGSTWSGLGSGSNSINPNTEKRTAQLSPNFTTNYELAVVNSSNDPIVSWNPAGAIGPITEGPVLTKVHSSYASSSAPKAPKATYATSGSQCYVVVDDLNATDADGNIVILKKGLILTQHSPSDVLDGTTGKEELLIWKITEHTGYFRLHLCGYRTILNLNVTGLGVTVHDIKTNLPTTAQNMIFKQPTMNGYSQYSCNRLNTQDPLNHGYGLFDEDMGIANGTPGVMPVFYNIEIVEEIEREAEIPSNPAIWETEPKENTPLDIYYEASNYNPLQLTDDVKNIVIPIGSTVKHVGNDQSIHKDNRVVEFKNFPNGNSSGLGSAGDFGWSIKIQGQMAFNLYGMGFYTAVTPIPKVGGAFINIGDKLKISKPDGSSITVTVKGWGNESNGEANLIYIEDGLHGPNTSYTLNWHNCYSFGNGVESNRVRDSFNLPFIANGVKASTTLEFSNYKEEHRKYGLIYSGLYNANSGINNLNQFIAGEKITKDINPTYGSIQKLHARDTDLITLCEDKVLQILASKDAVFEADGNPQLVATNKVLGQSRPFVGEYGISKNPESFASESYRVYFTDKIRGSVIRLSKDGLTPISDAGMKDWFKDNLKLSRKLIGSYDDKKDQYNITTTGTEFLGKELVSNKNFDNNGDGWTAEDGWSFGNSVASYDGESYKYIQQEGLTLTQGKTYRVTFKSNTTTGNPIAVYLGGSTVLVDVSNTNESHSVDLVSSNYYNSFLRFYAGKYAHEDRWSGNIHDISVKEVTPDPKTVSFKESVRGWVSFKSFVPENGLSCANDYFTVKNGKLYQHHIDTVDRNTFYENYVNSSIDVVLNEAPSSIKSFHALSYEGSQSRVEGVKKVEVTGIQHNSGTAVDGKYFFFEVLDVDALLGYSNWANSSVEVKQYRDNILIRTDLAIMFGSLGNSLFPASPSGGPTKGHGRWNSGTQPGDFEVGDVITTQLQEDSIHAIGSDLFNSKPTDGWYTSNIITDQAEGGISEFIKKENKWFNYIKGVNSTIDETTDFSAFEIQGLGIVEGVNGNFIDFSGETNVSIQKGDTIYLNSGSDTTRVGNVAFVSGNTVEIETGGTMPQATDYCFFVKNKIVNMSNLLGYYANAKFENNSKQKVEMFTVSAEITESSK